MELKNQKKIKIKKQTVMRRIRDLGQKKLKRKEITLTETIEKAELYKIIGLCTTTHCRPNPKITKKNNLL